MLLNLLLQKLRSRKVASIAIDKVDLHFPMALQVHHLDALILREGPLECPHLPL